MVKFDFSKSSLKNELRPMVTGPLFVKNDYDTDAVFLEVKIVYGYPLSILRLSNDGVDLLISFFQPKLNVQNYETHDPVLYVTRLSSI